MEITNDNYKILYKNSLKIKDIIRFKYNHKVYTYEVREQYLHNIIGYNDEIFTELKINKYFIANKEYGYPCGDGSWPEYKNQDYRALTRLVIFLFEEIESREKPESSIKKEPEHKINTKVKIKIKVDSNIKITLK